MVTRKLFNEKKKKEPAILAPEPRKVKRGLDISNMPDAIVDGKLTVPIGSRVIIPRMRSGREVLSTGLIKKLEDDGSVHFWDETNAQWFVFMLTDKVVVKVSDRAPS
jgi:hypothetical protein